MTKRLHSILFHTMIVSVYAVFFSVQFFFNFDGPEPGNGQTILSYSHASRPAIAGAGFINRIGNSSVPTHTNIRLNKRFHQENIPPCDVVSMDKPESFVIRKTPGHYPDPFLPSSSSHRLPLRGPPAVV